MVGRNVVINSLILWKMQYSCCGDLADVGMLSDTCLQLTLCEYLNVSGDNSVRGGGLDVRSSFGNCKKRIM